MKRDITQFSRACLLAGATWLASAAVAQSLVPSSPPQNHPVAIVNATVHPISAESIEHGYIVFAKGVITEIGAGEYRGASGETIIHDADGLHVYPGLISADTTIGLSEIGAVRATNDQSEVGGMTPEVRACVAVNPDTALIPVTRANGILTALIVPQGGTVSGYASLIRMEGWTWEELAINDRAGLVIRWPRMRPIDAWWMRQSEEEQLKEAREALERLETTFADAAAYIKARDAADSRHPLDLRLEAYRPALTGAAPVFIHANQASQIRSAVSWAVRHKFACVIVGGHEADQCLELLKAHDIPVIVVGTHRMPSRRDAAYDEAFSLPARLAEAGVRFCIATGEEPAHERNLPHHAATAAAYGLDPDHALRAITLDTARILEVDDMLGAIEPGLAATLIVTTGNPLEITTDVLAAYVEGSRIDLGNKQIALNEKYRTRYEQLGLLDGEDSAEPTREITQRSAGSSGGQGQ